jgi:hypothetical protein
MDKRLLELLKKVVVLLDAGVEPSNLEYVLDRMGLDFQNGINYELSHIIKRLNKYYTTADFKSDTLVCDKFDLSKTK